jgi:hypothetical protein
MSTDQAQQILFLECWAACLADLVPDGSGDSGFNLGGIGGAGVSRQFLQSLLTMKRKTVKAFSSRQP